MDSLLYIESCSIWCVRLIACILFFVVTGCASNYGSFDITQSQKPFTIQTIPLPTNTSTAPRIFVMRPDKAYASDLSELIFEGNELVGVLSRGSVLIWETHPGKKKIYGKRGRLKTCLIFYRKCVNSKEGLLEPISDSDAFDTNIVIFDAENGQNYFIRLDMDFFSRHDNLKVITREQANLINLKDEEKTKLETYFFMNH